MLGAEGRGAVSTVVALLSGQKCSSPSTPASFYTSLPFSHSPHWLSLLMYGFESSPGSSVVHIPGWADSNRMMATLGK